MRVVVRVRPGAQDGAVSVCAAGAELGAGATLHVSRDGDEIRRFSFPCVLGPDASQFDVFERCGRALVDNVLAGINASLMAYGQTGSGKTYSMLGTEGGQSQRHHTGIVPQVIDELFRKITQLKSAEGCPEINTEITASVVEIYNGRCFDLLANSPREPANALPIREAQDGSAQPLGARSVTILTRERLMNLLAETSARRRTGDNGHHAQSSRSHAVLTLTLERRTPATTPSDENPVTVSAGERSKGRAHHIQRTHLQLIDLAGSEGYSGAREGINEGLFVLGKVIRALAAKAAHVPFREHILTRLLLPSMKNNTATMLACVHAAANSEVEILSTLQYAATAASIKLPCARQQPWTHHTDTDPLEGDMLDPDQLIDRRTIWIPGGSGDNIFARCVGDVRDPLILYIHGSGPRNSSLQWNRLIQDLALRGTAETHRTVSSSSPPPPTFSKCKRTLSAPKTQHRASSSSDVESLIRKKPHNASALRDVDVTVESLCRTLRDDLAALEAWVTKSKCDLCSAPLVVKPHSFPCGHVLCGLCLEGNALYTHTCDVCGAHGVPKPDHERAVRLTNAHRRCGNKCGTVEDRRQEEEEEEEKARRIFPTLEEEVRQLSERLGTAERERRCASRIVLAFGSRCVARGNKLAITTFMRTLPLPAGTGGDRRVERRGAPVLQGAISHVDFNINPDFAKPTARVGRGCRGEGGGEAFEFEYCMSRPFPCHMTVHFSPRLGIAPLYVPYRTSQHSQERHIIMQLSQHRGDAGRGRDEKKQKVGGKRGGSGRPKVTFSCADKPESGWVIFPDNRAGEDPTVIAGNRFRDLSEAWLSTPSFRASGATVASAESACKTLVECAHHSCTPESLAHYLCVEGGSLQEQEDASGLELLQYIAQRLASWGVSERETMERECVRRIRVTYLKLIEAVSAHEEVPSSSHRTQYYCGQGHQEGDGEEGGADSVQQTRTFFHVAIDCPGYGRSLGDCQTIRSYPAQVLRQVFSGLGKPSAYALVGSSQGACAVFNALVEQPELATFVVVCHPVMHDPARFTGIQQPALLIYDTDDPGHPVSVGRRVKHVLQRPFYYEHSSREEPAFHELYMADLMLKLFSRFPKLGGGGGQLPFLGKLAGGLMSWHRAHGREVTEWEADNT